jgi:hypothetical protein
VSSSYSRIRVRTLLKTPVEAEPALFFSTTLWSAPGPRDHLALAPFIRYLLLRELADRTEEPRWNTVFISLRDQLSQTDLGGLLHHNLALGNTTMVTDELARLLPIRSGQEWLTLLDQTVATPHFRLDFSGVNKPSEAGNEHPALIARLVRQLHTLSDPCISNRDTLRRSYMIISADYSRLACMSPDGLTLFLDRARQYQRLADILA